jgi:hypothetical protein
MRPTYVPPRCPPRWPFNRECQPPRPPGPPVPKPLAGPTAPTGHSQVTGAVSGSQYGGEQPWQFALPGGTIVGNRLPLQIDPGPAAKDGRTCALEALGRYLTENVYRRLGDAVDPSPVPGQAPAKAFSLPAANFYTDEPDPEQDMLFPSIAVAGGDAEKSKWLGGGEPDPESRDVWAPGTVLVPLWRHEEDLQLKVYGSQLASLRGLMGGVEQLLQPSNGVGSVRLVLPDYYNEVCRFFLVGTDWTPQLDAVRNRRYAVHRLHLDMKIVRLVAYAEMIPSVTVDTETPEFASPLTSQNPYPAQP